jgi:hypothetical protein
MTARLLLLGGLLVACNDAELVQRPDAGQVNACVARAVTFCDAMAPSAGGCVADVNDPRAKLLPNDASYPLGCLATVLDGHQDVSGTCIVSESCRCDGPDAGDDGGGTPPPLHWSCSP